MLYRLTILSIFELTDKASCPCPLPILKKVACAHLPKQYSIVVSCYLGRDSYWSTPVIVLLITISFHLLRSRLWTWDINWHVYHLYGPTPYIDTDKMKELVDSLSSSGLAIMYVQLIASARAWSVWAWHTFEGVVSWYPLFRSKFVLENHVGSWSFVRCPETRSVRFSEVAYVLQSC